MDSIECYFLNWLHVLKFHWNRCTKQKPFCASTRCAVISVFHLALNECFHWSYASWRVPPETWLSGLLALFRQQYQGPYLTPLIYHLNNWEAACYERIFHAYFKSKEFCNEFFHSASGKKKKKGNIFPIISALFQPKRVGVIRSSIRAKQECKVLLFFLFNFFF